MRPPASGARACLPPPPPVARRFGYQKRSTLPGRSRAFSRCGAAMVKYCIVVHLPCTAEEYMILKDDPEYVRYQLGEVGARELSRVSELGADGFVTQTIVNRPNIAVPRVLRPLLRGKEIEFRDVRRYRHGTHTAVPFEMELAVFNSISDRVEQRARIRIANVRVDADGAVRRDDATYRKKEKGVAGEDEEVYEEDEDEDAEDPFVSSPARVAERVALGVLGAKTCEIRCVGEVTTRFGPLSRRAEELTVANMRRAYGRFPAVMAEWRRRKALPLSVSIEGASKRVENVRSSTVSEEAFVSSSLARGDSVASSEGSTRGDDELKNDAPKRGFFASRWIRAALEKADAARLRAKKRRAIRIRGARQSSHGRCETIVVPDDEYLF